jgi:hypothetical protein
VRQIFRNALSLSYPCVCEHSELRFNAYRFAHRASLSFSAAMCVATDLIRPRPKPRGGLGQTPSARGLSSQENPGVKFQRHPRMNNL